MKPRVALETTLLAHGVPKADAVPLADRLTEIVSREGAVPAIVGVVRGELRADLSQTDLISLLAEPDLPKLNTPSLGLAIASGSSGATTVSTTIEIAASRGIRMFATGGIGGVHRGYDTMPDVSADLLALSRYPVAVVASGCKSILDVPATREALETLGVPVIGFGTASFPAFYMREDPNAAACDTRFDDVESLAEYLRFELTRRSCGVLIANPPPHEHAIEQKQWDGWFEQACREADQASIVGRGWTPFVLGRLHALSEGKTLATNIALIESNTRLAAQLAVAMDR